MYLTIKLGIFYILEAYSKFKFGISEVHDLGNFELSPMLMVYSYLEASLFKQRDLDFLLIPLPKQTQNIFRLVRKRNLNFRVYLRKKD